MELFLPTDPKELFCPFNHVRTWPEGTIHEHESSLSPDTESGGALVVSLSDSGYYWYLSTNKLQGRSWFLIYLIHLVTSASEN
jgi:hypothetical protein